MALATPTSGCVLAEIGLESPAEMALPCNLPSWVLHEVSEDIRFTGGALARLTVDQAGELIRQVAAAKQ